MSIAMPNLTEVEHSTASRITFGRGPRVLVLPGKWQRIAAAILINADYTVIETTTVSASIFADVIVDTSSDRKLSPMSIAYTPDDVAAFLKEVESSTRSVERFSHIVSL